MTTLVKQKQRKISSDQRTPNAYIVGLVTYQHYIRGARQNGSHMLALMVENGSIIIIINSSSRRRISLQALRGAEYH